MKIHLFLHSTNIWVSPVGQAPELALSSGHMVELPRASSDQSVAQLDPSPSPLCINDLLWPRFLTFLAGLVCGPGLAWSHLSLFPLWYLNYLLLLSKWGGQRTRKNWSSHHNHWETIQWKWRLNEDSFLGGEGAVNNHTFSTELGCHEGTRNWSLEGKMTNPSLHITAFFLLMKVTHNTCSLWKTGSTNNIKKSGKYQRHKEKIKTLWYHYPEMINRVNTVCLPLDLSCAHICIYSVHSTLYPFFIT